MNRGSFFFSDKTDTYESTHITEIRVKELGDRHKLDLERLENERDEIERRLQLLQDELAEKQRTIDRQLIEIEELKQRYESEINAHKSEMIALETKYQNEHDDERDQHQRVSSLLKYSPRSSNFFFLRFWFNDEKRERKRRKEEQ
uniref:IF rod domain-containing protein n=1 Tax=Ascaris lumbricoides TaxID=6252 RepID=A0A0M3HKY7_ASCLU